jgi:hypothetical protein
VSASVVVIAARRARAVPEPAGRPKPALSRAASQRAATPPALRAGCGVTARSRRCFTVVEDCFGAEVFLAAPIAQPSCAWWQYRGGRTVGSRVAPGAQI